MRRWLPSPVKAALIERRQRPLAIRPWADITERIGPVDSVAVVGNAGYLAGMEQGERIDGHALVVRMNNFRTAGFEPAVGSRCDIFLANFFKDIDFDRPEVGRAAFVASSVPNNFTKSDAAGLFHRHGEHIAAGMERMKRKEVFVPPPAIFRDSQALCGGMPSTGFMAVRLVLGEIRCRTIFLAGFSFFHGRQHYFNAPAAPRPRHDFERERRVLADMLRPLLADGRVRVDPVMARHLFEAAP
jgi:hypothetical protein